MMQSINGNQSFQRFAALAAVISFFTALTSNLLQGIPIHFSPDIMTNPTLILSVGVVGARLLRWGLILDMLGYYLPLLPVALFIQRWFKLQKPLWIHFYTACGLAYILIGATGAVILAAIQWPLISAYGQAVGEQRYALEAITKIIWNIVYGGMWNILGELLIGIWFLGVGLLLQSERRGLGIAGLVIGAAALLDSLGTILGIEALAFLGLSIFLLLAPIWALWLGIDLLRKPVQF